MRGIFYQAKHDCQRQAFACVAQTRYKKCQKYVSVSIVTQGHDLDSMQ